MRTSTQVWFPRKIAGRRLRNRFCVDVLVENFDTNEVFLEKPQVEVREIESVLTILLGTSTQIAFPLRTSTGI